MNESDNNMSQLLSNNNQNNKSKNLLIICITLIIVTLIIGIVIIIVVVNNSSTNKESDKNQDIKEEVEKTPLELAEEEKEKLKKALMNEGFTASDDRMVFEKNAGIIYVFSFRNYSYSSSGNELTDYYYLLTDSGTGNWLPADSQAVANYTYDFKTNTGTCFLTTAYGTTPCTSYTSLISLKSNFLTIINKYGIDLDIMLNK